MEQVMSTIKKFTTRRGALVISGAFILIVGLFFVSVLPSSRLVVPIDDQLEAIRIEDNVTAYSFTSSAFQKATSLDAFIRFINEYSGLRNNDNIIFDERNIKNGIGKVKARLISRSGMETPVTYQLVKENDRWKIESIILTPQGGDEPITTSSDAQPTTAAATTTPPATTTAETTTPADNSINTYQDPNNAFTLIYPDEWQFIKDNNKVVFNGKPGTVSNQSSFTIQPLDDNQSVQDVADQGEAIIKEKSAGSYKVVDDGLLPPRSNKNDNYHGKYAVYSYTVDNQPMKQLQIIYFKSPKRAKYIVDFVAPESQFDTDLPAAKAMIASFTIS